MCGRYYYDDYMWADLLEDFPELSEALPNASAASAASNASDALSVPPGRAGAVYGAPGDVTPAMKAWSLAAGRTGDGGLPLRPALLSWGFPGRGGKLIINARAEGIAERPTFTESIRSRRCVLPAAGFYEWDRDRRKVRFSLPDRPVLYLAGIWRPAGEGPQFVVITREANDSMRPVHDRMPLMIAPEDVRDWIARPERTEAFLAQPLPPLKAERDYEQMKWDLGVPDGEFR